MTVQGVLPVGAAVRVRAPASSANLGPGFDSIGLALGVWDELDFTVTAQPGLVIDVAGSGAEGVPRDESHLVYRSFVRALREIGVAVPAGLRMETRNAVPHGRGMGSSATAIVAGVVAAYGIVGRETLRAPPVTTSRSTWRPSTASPASWRVTRITPRRRITGA